MKKLTMLLTIFLSIFIVAPSVVFAGDYTLTIDGPHMVAESAGTVTFTVSIDRAVDAGDGNVFFDYWTIEGTAEAASDFTAVSANHSWNEGEGADKLISVNILPDSLVEDFESFTVVLMNAVVQNGGTVSFSPPNGNTGTCNINI